MNIDADDHGEERIPLFGMDAHAMQMVIIEHPVIHFFTGSVVVVNHLILRCTSGYRSIESDIPVWFRVDTPAIRGWGTLLFTSAGIHSATSEGTAPFTRMLLFTVPPVDHTETGHAQGSTVFVNGDGIGDRIRPSAVGVEVDKRADSPFPAKPIGGIVAISGIQTEVTNRDIGVEGFDGCKFAQRDNSGDAVVPPGVYETEMQGEVNAKVRIMGTEHIKGMAEKEGFFVTVSSLVSVWVREMALARAMCDSVFRTVTDFMTVRG